MAFSLIQLADVAEEIYDTMDVHLFVTIAITADGIIYLFIYLIFRKRRKVFPTGLKKRLKKMKNKLGVWTARKNWLSLRSWYFLLW